MLDPSRGYGERPSSPSRRARMQTAPWSVELGRDPARRPAADARPLQPAPRRQVAHPGQAPPECRRWRRRAPASHRRAGEPRAPSGPRLTADEAQAARQRGSAADVRHRRGIGGITAVLTRRGRRQGRSASTQGAGNLAAPAAKAAAERRCRAAPRRAADAPAITSGIRPHETRQLARPRAATARRAKPPKRRASLLEFQKSYPDFVVPSDLAPLLRE